MTKSLEIKETTDTLKKIIQQQINKYEEIMVIDNAIINSAEFSGLDKQMEVRKNLFAQLDNMARLVISMQTELAGLLNVEEVIWENILNCGELADKDALKELFFDLKQRITNLAELDNRVADLLEKQKNEIRNKLKNISQHKVLEHAYHDLEDNYPTPQIFDKTK